MQKLFGWLKENLVGSRIDAIKLCAVALIVFVPLYPKFPFLRLPGTFVSIRLEDFIVFVSGAVWFFFFALKKKKNYWRSTLNQAILLFWAVAFVSVVSSVFLTKTVSAHIGFFHWLRRIEYMLPLFVGMEAIREKNDLKFFVRLLTLVVIIIFLYSLGQKYFRFPVITTQNQEYSKGIALTYLPGGHLVSTFAGHYDLSSFLVLVSPIYFALLFSTERLFFEDKKRERLFLVLILGITFWMLVNTVSRISFFTYIGSAAFTFFILKKYKLIPVVIFSLLFLGALSPGLRTRYLRIWIVATERVRGAATLIMYKIQNPVFAQEVSPGEVPPIIEPVQDVSTSIRLAVEWPRALRAFSKNPILGTGYSSITLATDNDYLRALGETGTLGFLAFVSLLLVVWQSLSRPLPIKRIDIGNSFLAGIIGGFGGILVNGVFIDIFESSKFAIVFWLLIGFGILVKRDEKTSS